MTFGIRQDGDIYRLCTRTEGKEWLDSIVMPGTYTYRWQACRAFGNLFGGVVTRWLSPQAKSVCVGEAKR